jgi:hypothetical protein
MQKILLSKHSAHGPILAIRTRASKHQAAKQSITEQKDQEEKEKRQIRTGKEEKERKEE